MLFLNNINFMKSILNLINKIGGNDSNKKNLNTSINYYRLSRNTFNYLHGIIKEDLNRKVSGNPTICSSYQLMIALWKMATMDSYRLHLFIN